MEDVFSHDSEEQPPVFCMQMASFSHLQASSSGPKLRSVPYSLCLRKCPLLSLVYSGSSLSQCRPLLLCMVPCWCLGCRETQADKLSVPSQSGQPRHPSNAQKPSPQRAGGCTGGKPQQQPLGGNTREGASSLCRKN